VLLVTGGGRGIGAATARLGAKRGYAVCVNYLRDQVSAEGVVQDIRSDGGSAVAVAGDVASEKDVLHLFDACDRSLGPLSALVNNAGIVVTGSRVEAMSAERLQRMFATNAVGAFLCAREAIKRMSTKHGGKGGAIVTLSSVAARTGGIPMESHYAASKGALDSFTIGLAKEVGTEGVRVNAVRPGFILTAIHEVHGGEATARAVAPTVPLGRVGEPAEVAEAVLWLASDAASYLHGAIIDVSGGR